MTRAARALPCVVALLALVAFLPALDAGFVDWDDDRNLLDNTGYRGLGGRQLRWMLTATWMGHYIPLTWLTLGVNYALGGLAPRGYHLGNLLLHAASAAVLCLVARRLIARGLGVPAASPAVAAGAAVAAAAWAVHPLRAESVAWVTERRDVLCGLFYLLAALAYLRGVEGGGRLRGRWLAASLGAFAAALLSKAMAMTLPVSLLVLDAWPLGRRPLGWATLVREKLGHLALAALGAAVAAWAVTRGAAWTGYEVYGPAARLAMTGYSFWFYPGKLVWPEGLSPLYELPARVSLLEARFLGPALGVVAVTAVLVAARRRFPGGLVAWLHSIIVLAPVSGVAHAGYQLAHDRYSYLSGLGFALLAGAGVTWVARARAAGRVGRPLGAIVAAGVLAALAGTAAAAWQQTRIWHDSASLWQAAVAADPGCALCRHKLGNALMAAGRRGAAEAELRQAAALRPERAGPHVSLGTLYADAGQPALAEAEYREAMRLSPRGGEAPANLGALYARQGRNAEAIALLRHALALAPWLDGARANLAHALENAGVERARAGRLAEATALFREATTLLPDDPGPWRGLGQALVEQGRAGEALPALERAVALRPRGGPERFWLARAYLAAGRPADAAVHIAALRELDPAAAARVASGSP